MKVEVSKKQERVCYELSVCKSRSSFIAKVVLIVISVYLYQLDILWWLSIFPCLAMFLFRTKTKEYVLVIKGLGVQTGQKGFIRFLQDNNMFFPKSSISAVVINEVFEGFRINYVLQVIIHGNEQMSLVFPAFRPRLEVLREVWQDINLI